MYGLHRRGESINAPEGKRSKTGCGVFLPEHMLKLAMSELEKYHD